MQLFVKMHTSETESKQTCQVAGYQQPSPQLNLSNYYKQSVIIILLWLLHQKWWLCNEVLLQIMAAWLSWHCTTFKLCILCNWVKGTAMENSFYLYIVSSKYTYRKLLDLIAGCPLGGRPFPTVVLVAI